MRRHALPQRDTPALNPVHRSFLPPVFAIIGLPAPGQTVRGGFTANRRARTGGQMVGVTGIEPVTPTMST
jgi:hypothetical protein